MGGKFIVALGKEGLGNSYQNEFPPETKCCRCGGISRIGFVAMEEYDKESKAVCNLHLNKGKGNYWLHDLCAVAVYFCKDCLQPTALYNQG